MPDKKTTGIMFENGDAPGNGRVLWFGPGKLSPAWCTLPLLATGGAVLYAALHCLHLMSVHHWLLPLAGGLFLGLIGSVFLFAGAVTAHLLVKLPRTVPVENLGAKLGITPAEVKREAEARGVRPPYSINGRDFYRPEDFAAVSLLRSASETGGEEQLLRAAAGADADTRSEELLRAEPAEASCDSVQHVYGHPNEPETVAAGLGVKR